jgi:intein/homing endonuclease
MAQIGNRPDIEVIGLFDNKKRSVGHKRNELLKLAQGEYLCFKGNTQIETDKGIKIIKKIKKGDMVKTHKNRFRKVLKTIKIPLKQRSRLIWVNSGLNTIKCTPEHPFLVNRSEEIKWIEAKNLLLTDKLLYPYNHKEDYLDLNFDSERWDKEHFGKIKVDQNFARFMGLYLAEGNSNTNGICFTFNNNEKQYHKFIIQICKEKFGRNPTIYKRWATQIILNMRFLGVRFKEYFGKNAREKRIPSFVKNWNLINKLSFIRGYLEGDGSQDGQFCSVSKKLLQDLSDLCNDCCLHVSKIISYGPMVSKLKNDHLIKNTESNYCFINKKSVAKIYNLLNAASFKNYLMMNIESLVEKKQARHENPHNQVVYNLEVEEDNTFIADNVITHNCFIDDDDDIAPDYISSVISTLYANPTADCIVFDCITTMNGDKSNQTYSKYSIDYEYIQVQEPGPNPIDPTGRIAFQWRGKPAHTMIYKSEIAKKHIYINQNYGEDVDWVKRACLEIKNEVRIDKVLYYYNFNSAVSETRG